MTTTRHGTLGAEGTGTVPPARRRAASATAPLLPAGHPALHVTNRLAFGATPDLVRDVLADGPEAWIARQLRPETIDDRACDELVAASFPPLAWTAQELATDDDVKPWHADLVLRLATLQRAVHSRRQLHEVLVWFWSNHFSVFPGNDVMKVTLVVQDREAVRPHVLGRFDDLLLAVARGPAMLAYLDNDSSRAPDVNENYARELMELHTLGGDDAFTEVDVRAVAGVLAGWTIADDLTFAFEPGWQDAAAVRAVGLDVPAGRDLRRGELLLRHLAHHPRTARFVVDKLLHWFVGPRAGESLRAAAVATYLATGTDLRATLEVVLASSDFWASAGERLHAPFGWLARVLRALHVDLGLERGHRSDSARQLHDLLARMGQLPFGWHPPNGYPDVDAYWTSPGLLAQRWNAAHRLCRDRVWGTRVDLSTLLAGVTTVGEAVDRCVAELTCRRPTPEERAVLVTAAGGDESAVLAEHEHETVRLLAGLVLCLPSTQER